jgi:hypothetical protein
MKPMQKKKSPTAILVFLLSGCFSSLAVAGSEIFMLVRMAEKISGKNINFHG